MIETGTAVGVGLGKAVGLRLGEAGAVALGLRVVMAGKAVLEEAEIAIPTLAIMARADNPTRRARMRRRLGGEAIPKEYPIYPYSAVFTTPTRPTKSACGSPR